MFRKIGKKAAVSLSSETDSTLPTVVLPPKKRPRGLEMVTTGPVEVEQDLSLVQKVFVRSSERLDAAQNKYLEKYIEERIGRKAGETVEEVGNTEEKDLYSVPKQYQVDESAYEEALERTNWLSGLAEVPLTIEHKLDNIEQTENSKRKLLKTGQSSGSRFEDIHYEEVEAFHARRLQSKVDEAVYKQLEKEFKLTRRDRAQSRAGRLEASRQVERQLPP